MKDEVVPGMRRLLRRAIPTASPYAGGVEIVAPDAPAHHGAASPLQVPRLGVSVLNPGRTGFTCLGTHDVLTWRLWHVALALQECGVSVCALPGARWPPGASLPEGFPFLWHGVATESWAGVGFFVSVDLAQAAWVVSDVGNDRVVWLALSSAGQPGGSPALVVGAFYAAPGGDVDTWTRLLEEHGVLKARFPRAAFCLAGDGNAHLSSVVSHGAECRCAHCAQSPADRTIQALLEASGLAPLNDGTPTHTSGSVIDLLLAPVGWGPPAQVLQMDVGQSDHSLVFACLPASLEVLPSASVGRVSWVLDADWDPALAVVAGVLRQLELAVALATVELAVSPGIPLARRSLVVDCAAWLRDVVYLLVGHCAGLARFFSGRPSRPPPSTLPTAGFP